MPELSVRVRIVLIGLLTAFLGFSYQPRQLSAALEETRRSLKNDQPADAAESLKVVLEYEPWHADLWVAAGRYALAGNDDANAVTYLEAASKRGLLGVSDWIALGDAYQALGNPAQAVHAWKQAIAVGGPAIEPYRRMLAVYQASQDFASILETLRYLTLMQPGDGPLYYQTGLYLAASDPEAAIVYLERAAELDPELASQTRKLLGDIHTALLAEDLAYTLVSSGRSLASLGEWGLAKEAFQKAAALQPDYAEAWAFLAEARQQLGGKEAGYAWGDLSKALQLNPDSLAVNLLAALYDQRMGNYDLALSLLKSAVRQEPENPFVQVELGNVYTHQGDLPNAEQAYRKAVELEPEEVSFRRALVNFLLRHQIQLRDAALPVARQAVILAPENAPALDLLGETLFMLGDYYNSRRILEHALRVDPEYAPALMHLGVTMLFLDESEPARELLEASHRLAVDAETMDQSSRLLQYYFP